MCEPLKLRRNQWLTLHQILDAVRTKAPQATSEQVQMVLDSCCRLGTIERSDDSGEMRYRIA